MPCICTQPPAHLEYGSVNTMAQEIWWPASSALSASRSASVSGGAKVTMHLSYLGGAGLVDLVGLAGSGTASNSWGMPAAGLPAGASGGWQAHR